MTGRLEWWASSYPPAMSPVTSNRSVSRRFACSSGIALRGTTYRCEPACVTAASGTVPSGPGWTVTDRRPSGRVVTCTTSPVTRVTSETLGTPAGVPFVRSACAVAAPAGSAPATSTELANAATARRVRGGRTRIRAVLSAVSRGVAPRRGRRAWSSAGAQTVVDDLRALGHEQVTSPRQADLVHRPRSAGYENHPVRGRLPPTPGGSADW